MAMGVLLELAQSLQGTDLEQLLGSLGVCECQIAQSIDSCVSYEHLVPLGQLDKQFVDFMIEKSLYVGLAVRHSQVGQDPGCLHLQLRILVSVKHLDHA